MIKAFEHSGIEAFFKRQSKAGIQPKHAKKTEPSARGSERGKEGIGHEFARLGLAALKGQLAGRWSVSVSGNWRLTYAFQNGDAILIDYEDYH